MDPKYKLIIFDMDGTLLRERTIFKLAEKIGFEKDLLKVLEQEKFNYVRTKKIATYLKGLSVEEFLTIFRSIPLNKHVEEVVDRIKKSGMKTAIASDSYDIAVEDLRKRLGMDFGFANHLVTKNGMITGEIEFHNKNIEASEDSCRSYSICKRDVVEELCEQLNISCQAVVAIGDGKVDRFMLDAAGFGVAFNAPEIVQEHADVCISDMKDLLQHIF